MPNLISKTKDMGYPAIAVTDTANMFGAKAFSTYASKDGIKPILGCQFYLRNPDADDVLKSKGRTIDPDKIVLLVKDEDGRKNIMELMKISYLDNPEPTEKPQLKLEDLEQLSAGLIALTAGPDGPIGRLLLENRIKDAEDLTLRLKEIFSDRLYMEISRIGTEAEQKTENSFIDLAYKHNIPLVATNEAFFFTADMYEAHDALICIAQGEYLVNESRKRHSPNNRLKSENEMAELFKDLPEALENTINIAKRCNFISEFVSPLLPKFDCPDSQTENEYIKKRSREGLEERMRDYVYFEGMTDQEKKEIDEKYFSRLDFEISVIEKMGFEGYFLIVADFINWSKQNDIPVGPGRGSGAGSIVAWSLKITDLDPIKWDLLFERFLNPDRISMPDFDVDFCQDKRGQTIEYVQNKYGYDKVAQIITYGKLQSKAVIRDVARVLQMPYSQADRISKMIPAGVQGKNPTLQEALDQVPELEDMRKNDPQINKLFDIAMKLEGLYRHSGVHAAGVVIGDRPLKELVPLYKDPKADMPVTQYDMKYIEETGLIKFDFLGLKTLTVIQKTIKSLAHKGINVDIDKISLDDHETYQLLQRGDTAAVFQFESAGMKDVHKQIKPDRFEDLIAIVSLYRPGPMDNIPSYIKRKHGEEEVTYMHPKLEEVLAETYGIMVYQEQVMRISQLLAGYTKGEADNLRKAMGKKIHEQMAKHRVTFVDGCIKNGIEQQTAVNIFDAMEKFASYGFNKSHAAAYSLISYQTAYLKAHYPVEFMASVMTLDITNTDKLLFFKEECKKIGIKVLPPDINKSRANFCVEDEKIRYALGAVKGVGEAAMRELVSERDKNGSFKNISDFIHRVDSKSLNRRMLEQLIKAGAFDSIEKNRNMLYENVELILRHIHTANETKTSSQASLFGGDELQAPVKLKDFGDWPELQKLRFEAEAIGFYLSAHPLDSYGQGMERLGVKSSSEVFRSIRVGDTIRAKLAGCVSSFQKRISKNGNKYAFLELSDANNSFEGILFSEGLTRFEDIITSGLPLLVSISISKESEDAQPRAMINSVETLDKAISEVANGLIICINNTSAISPLKEIVNRDQRGKNKIYIVPDNDNWDVRIELDGTYAFADQEFLSKIRNVQGITSIKEI